MRLDQGPTASFKDFAARLMGRLINYYLRLEKKQLLILTATSGDTGSAIANAFYGLDNIQVLVLFPEKEVTPRQRKQMTTLGGNVSIIAVDGKFDHCQALVKEAFSDPGTGPPAPVVGQFHQHRPPGAADRLLFLRLLAAAPAARRAGRFFRALGKFRRHDGRRAGHAHGPAGQAPGHRHQ